MVPNLIFIGPLPPPVHGQAIATRTVQEQLLNFGLQLRTIDLGAGSGGAPVTRKLRRGVVHLRAVLACRLGREPCAYISVGANKSLTVGPFIHIGLVALLLRYRPLRKPFLSWKRGQPRMAEAG
jgi:hypothetical protein